MSPPNPPQAGALEPAPAPMAERDSSAERTRRRGAGDTRNRLLEAGRRAFARRGLAGTNLSQHILEPAGIAVGSFYYQFRNKTELLVAILEEDSQDLRSALERVQQPTPGRSVLDIARASYAATFDVVDRHADTMRILIRESAVDDPSVQQFADQEQRNWIETLTRNFQRFAPADHSIEQVALAAELISVLTTGALAHYLGLPGQERPAARERLIDGLLRLTVGGLPALGFDEATLVEVARPLSTIADSDSPAGPRGPAERDPT